jgi:hypothetical protein
MGFGLLDLSFLCNVLYLVVCPFVLFLLAIALFFFDLQLLITLVVSSNFSLQILTNIYYLLRLKK